MQLTLSLEPVRSPSPPREGVAPPTKDLGPCPDCTYHRLVWRRGMWRCPGCNP